MQLNKKNEKVLQLFQKRRDGCRDMIQVLSEQLNLPKEVVLQKTGIDKEDFDDLEAFEILGLPIPVESKGTINTEEDDDEEEEEE